MAKRFTPIRLDERLRKSLDRFVEQWNRGGAPATNRTLVISTAIEQYLKNWRPVLTQIPAIAKGRTSRKSDRVVGFPHSPTERPIRGQQGLRRAM
jgi:hypothetical protein